MDKASNGAAGHFGWWQILRLGLVQACLGAVVVVTTSTLNRVMVVELALPALLPGFLVAWHYGVQMVRPRMGFGADQGRRVVNLEIASHKARIQWSVVRQDQQRQPAHDEVGGGDQKDDGEKQRQVGAGHGVMMARGVAV